MVRSSNPGWCFKVAGCRKYRTAARGLIELEKMPEFQRYRWPPPGGERPFSATGRNADSRALRGGGGKGTVILGILGKRYRYGCFSSSLSEKQCSKR